MADHRDLTGADLHEPKGADSAAANLVYVSSGTGTGTWKKIPPEAIDPTLLPSLNRAIVSAKVGEVSTAPSTMIPIPINGKVISAIVTIDDILTGSNLSLTFTKTGGLSLGSPLVLPIAGSGLGSTFVFTPTLNQTLVPNDYLRITTSSGTTGSANLFVTFLIEKG